MKFSIAVILISLTSVSFAQKNVVATSEFTITGKVKTVSRFSLKDVAVFPDHTVDSIVIYNHLHERKRTIHNVKGILLKELLEKAGVAEDKPKLLSEFYFTCVASDGYKVVFSWNELFNTEIGNQTMIIIEQEGKSADAAADHIALISPLDNNTGRRYVQNLKEIKVDRVQ